MKRVIFELRNAGIWGPEGPLLSRLDLKVPDCAVTVVLGPGGTGKSLLLRALARTLPRGLSLSGHWLHRGRALGPAAPLGVWWRPQRRHPSVEGLSGLESIEGAFEKETLLLDEPTAGRSETARGELERRLRRHRTRGAAVVVTHDLRFARAVADRAVLIVNGGVQAADDVPAFFDRPPDRLVERFLRQGNCWPEPERPNLPRHLFWIRPGRVGGMGRPGRDGTVEADLEAIAAAGVGLLISLTEDPFPEEHLRRYGIRGLHFPIRDMDVPKLGPTASLCHRIDCGLHDGETVVVHCRAGLGRTGTILAALLAWWGDAPGDAVAQVRRLARGAIQTSAQREFVHRFAATFGCGEVSRP